MTTRWALAAALAWTLCSTGADAQVADPEAAVHPTHRLKVAFVVSQRFNVIDFAGPWEAFNDARVPIDGKPGQVMNALFENYTVSDATKPIQSGGNQVTLVSEVTNGKTPRPRRAVLSPMWDGDAEVQSLTDL